MSVTYTNRRNRKYFLCQGTTKTGKPRYYFARNPNESVLDKIPDGYEIRESVNGVVSLAKARPIELKNDEICAIKEELQAHPLFRRYRIETKPKEILIYEQAGPDIEVIANVLAGDSLLDNKTKRQLEEHDREHSRFAPVMRFTLTDSTERLYEAERMCYRGGIEDWIPIAGNETVTELASALIPMLGTEDFFELV